MFGGTLGSFTNGLFGGMEAMQRITAQSQAIQQEQNVLDTENKMRDYANSRSVDQQDTSSPDSGSVDYGSRADGVSGTGGALGASTGAPVADVSRLPPLVPPASSSAPPPQTQTEKDAIDPVAAGDGGPTDPADAADDRRDQQHQRALQMQALTAPASYQPKYGTAAPAASQPVMPSTPADGPYVPPAGFGIPGYAPYAAPAAAGTTSAQSSAQPSAQQSADAGKPSLGASILAALNPVGSARADTRPLAPGAASGLPTAQQDTPPSSANAAGDPDSSGALAATIARMRQDAPPASSAAGATPDADITLPQRSISGSADGRTSDQVVTRGVLDSKPWAALQQQAPEVAKLVADTAARYNVTPDRLALHWQLESGMHATAPTSATGDVGPLQINKGTYQYLDPQGRRDPNKLADSLDLAAQDIHLADTRYGQNTPLSVGAYQGGFGSADAIAAGEGNRHPNTVAYMAKAFPGQKIGPDQMQPGHQMDPAGIMQAAQAQGPDGVLNYIARSGPPAAPMSDKWRQAESALMALAAGRGDVAGMEHARDFMFQQMHQGQSLSLMNAYQQLRAGDGVGAAKFLARADAFFPDGGQGRFGVDGAGNVWAQRVDEHDPTRNIGAPIQITPEKLQGMLVQSPDPNQFAATLSEQQKNVAMARFYAQHGDYYEQLPEVKQQIAQDAMANTAQIQAGHDKEKLQAAGLSADARQYGADAGLAGKELSPRGALGASIGANAGEAAGPGATASGLKPSQIDSEATRFYGGQDATPTGPLPPDQAGLASDIHQQLRSTNTGMTALGAKSVTLGLLNGSNVLRSVGNDNYGVFPKNATNGAPRAVISGALARHYQDIMLPSGLQGNAAGQAAPATVVQPSRSALPLSPAAGHA